ncbi:MAG: nicotinate-nucleotide adenylyltransferase [Thermoflexales bacterium]
MNIGIFGGTFDPPHIGHLVIADQALTQLKLDEVWFMPVGQPPHKAGNSISSAHHRARMVQLAIGDHPAFRLSLIDIERPAPHYSSAALELLEARHPQHDWCFIMGADSLKDLPHWHNPHRLIELATLAVAGRPGARPDLNAIEHDVPGVSSRVRWVNAPLVDISSTELRRMVRQNASLRYLVPYPVEIYIRTERLYRD